MTKKADNPIRISHVNIRTSIAFLLIKLLLLEAIAASAVILFFSVALSDFLTTMGITLPYLSIPVYVFFVLVKMLMTLYLVLQWLNEYYEVSTETVVHRKGVIFRYEFTFPLKHIRILRTEQTLWGKFFNYGNISLEDEYGAEKIFLYQIHNPVRYANILEDQLTDEIEVIRKVRGNILEQA